MGLVTCGRYILSPDDISPICEDQTISLVSNLDGSASMVTWTTNGDGGFDDVNSNSPIYTPGASDISNGSVTITATTDDPDGTGPCLEASADVVLNINMKQLPTFTQLGPYCVDDTPDILPLSSTNGISGNWDGPISTSTTGSSIYTFTPDDDECATSTTMLIEVNDCGCSDPATITIDDISPICEDQTISLVSNLDGSASIVTWTTNGDGGFDDDNSNSPIYTPGATDISNGSLTITATTDDPDGSGPCLEASADVLLMIDTSETPLFDQLGSYFIDEIPDLLPTTSLNEIEGTWDGPIVTSSAGLTTYTFITDTEMCVNSAIMDIEVNTPIETIELISIITPNGDGDNDILLFKGLEKYQDNTLRIYNRWGFPVYEKSGYQADDERWSGTKGGEELPADTYYYILIYNDKVHKSQLTILR